MWFHLDTRFLFICLQCTTWWPTWHVFLPKKTGSCGTQLSKMASWIAKPWIEQALMSETGKNLPKIARAQILKVGKTFLWRVGSNISQTSMDQETTNSAKFKNLIIMIWQGSQVYNASLSGGGCPRASTFGKASSWLVNPRLPAMSPHANGTRHQSHWFISGKNKGGVGWGGMRGK